MRQVRNKLYKLLYNKLIANISLPVNNLNTNSKYVNIIKQVNITLIFFNLYFIKPPIHKYYTTN